MIHAHIFENMQRAHYYAYHFIDEHRHKIEKTKRTLIYIIILKNGDEHHFLSRAVYDKWSMGRNYMIDDTLYRSGFPCKKEEK